MSSKSSDVRAAYQILVDRLRSLRTNGGYWTGQLSNSPLSTATAVSGLAVCLECQREKPNEHFAITGNDEPETWRDLIERGSAYLCKSQNADGGFGDTDRSHSNIATTLLAIAAWRLAGKQSELDTNIRRAEAYVERNGKWNGLRRRYGKDKTFVVPILSNCALAGMVPWTEVPPLPFEAAALPQSWYRFAQMPVVSYAVPALVAIGQARFVHAPPRNPLTRLLRWSALHRTRHVLRRMQPDSGGYLEATPLTSFVLMNLASIGLVDSDVAKSCRGFLMASVQVDGSWPIDTNLATWVTSLAMHGLRPLIDSSIKPDSVVREETIQWLLSCQHRVRHPFTGAEPGGWGWTDLSGAVPDADDTPAALLALHAWYCEEDTVSKSTEILSAVALGIQWLLKLQNRDGGWPTFCRGWGKLPFDRSGADLTAHAIRALATWSDQKLHSQMVFPNTSRNPLPAIQSAIQRGLKYLHAQQRADGSWLPLWFGNQDRPEEENPIYGTGRVLLAFGELGEIEKRSVGAGDEEWRTSPLRGIDYLLSQQNADGGWGGGVSVRYSRLGMHVATVDEPNFVVSSIEETSVAIEGLAACRSLFGGRLHSAAVAEPNRLQDINRAIDRAVEWLTAKIQDGDCETSQPIGFYFAKLWYYERLYPYVFAAAALHRIARAQALELD